MFRTNFIRRYPRDDPRYILTPEDAEVTKKKYILRTLKECTKTIEEADLKTINEAELMIKTISVVDDVKDGSTMIQNPRRKSILGSLFGARSLENRAHEGVEPKNKIVLAQAAEKGVSVEDDSTTVDPDTSADDIEMGNMISTNNSEDKVGAVPSSHESNGQGQEEEANVDNDGKRVVVLKIPCKTPETSNHSTEYPITSEEETSDACHLSIHSREESLRIVPECSICLNECKIGDTVCWSPQQNCTHVFHEDCILEWFLTLGRKSDERRSTASFQADFKMCCPVCRQEFIQQETSAEMSSSRRT